MNRIAGVYRLLPHIECIKLRVRGLVFSNQILKNVYLLLLRQAHIIRYYTYKQRLDDSGGKVLVLNDTFSKIEVISMTCSPTECCFSELALLQSN